MGKLAKFIVVCNVEVFSDMVAEDALKRVSGEVEGILSEMRKLNGKAG